MKIVSANKIKRKKKKKGKKYRIELPITGKAICLFAHPERIDESCSNGKWRERISRRVFESSNNADVSSISAACVKYHPIIEYPWGKSSWKKSESRSTRTRVKYLARVKYSRNLINIAIEYFLYRLGKIIQIECEEFFQVRE